MAVPRKKEVYKDLVIGSLAYLSNKGKIEVFAFVIMPNNIHLIWRVLESNGNESSPGSFLKYTAHEFKKMLVAEDPHALEDFRVDASNKNYEFWQRDSLAVPLFTRSVAYQKLDYIHANPLAGHWQIAKDSCAYKYSTARFYELEIKDFDFIKDLRDEF